MMKSICYKKKNGLYAELSYPFQVPNEDYREIEDLPEDCYVVPGVVTALRMACWLYSIDPSLDFINRTNPPYPKRVKRKGLPKEVAEVFRAIHVMRVYNADT